MLWRTEVEIPILVVHAYSWCRFNDSVYSMVMMWSQQKAYSCFCARNLILISSKKFNLICKQTKVFVQFRWSWKCENEYYCKITLMNVNWYIQNCKTNNLAKKNKNLSKYVSWGFCVTWHVILYSMIVLFQIILTGLKMERAVFPEVSVMSYCTTWPHIPENCDLHIHHLQNTTLTN